MNVIPDVPSPAAAVGGVNVQDGRQTPLPISKVAPYRAKLQLLTPTTCQQLTFTLTFSRRFYPKRLTIRTFVRRTKLQYIAVGN